MCKAATNLLYTRVRGVGRLEFSHPIFATRNISMMNGQHIKRYILGISMRNGNAARCMMHPGAPHDEFGLRKMLIN
jgi:hypothetical protein